MILILRLFLRLTDFLFLVMSFKFFSVLLALALSLPVLSTPVAQQVADLRLAPTAVDRVKLLTDDSDVSFRIALNQAQT